MGLVRTTAEEDYLVYSFYLGDISIPYTCCCPFPGEEEEHSSFSVYLSSAGALRWHMHNADRNGGVFDFIMNMEKVTFGPAFGLYNKIINGELKGQKPIQETKLKVRSTPTPSITVRNYFLPWEVEYWMGENKMGIRELIELDVYSLESLYYGDYLSAASYQARPKFIYPFFDETGRTIGWQMYNPLADKDKGEIKWRSGGTFTVGNIQNLPVSGPILFWTSSKKDGGTLYYRILDKKYPFIHSPMEGNIRPVVKIFKELKERFPRIIYIGDIDDNGRGQEISDKIKHQTTAEILNLDFGYDCKDITESYKSFGAEPMKKQILNYIK